MEHGAWSMKYAVMMESIRGRSRSISISGISHVKFKVKYKVKSKVKSKFTFKVYINAKMRDVMYSAKKGKKVVIT